MKYLLAALAVTLLPLAAFSETQVASIEFGAPERKTFPAAGKGDRPTVYLVVPVKTTNTSTKPLRFTTFSAHPDFEELIRSQKGAKRWASQRMTGMCGMMYGERTLEPGESLAASLLVTVEHSGDEYRLRLPVIANGQTITVRSPTIVLP